MLNILVFDIETTPNLGYVWGKYEQNVLSYVKQTNLLCYAYQWYGKSNTKVVALTDFESYKTSKTDDLALTKSLWDLFDKADVIIAHNGDAFDIKYANGRFLFHGLNSPSKYKTVDTLRAARRRFKLNSNSLNDVGELLKVGKKVQTGGFDLWLGCMNGDEHAWKRMKKYNKQDVELLIAVYEKLRPWIQNHPNISFHSDMPACPKCACTKLWKLGKDKFSHRQRWRCTKCQSNVYTTINDNKPKPE